MEFFKIFSMHVPSP